MSKKILIVVVTSMVCFFAGNLTAAIAGLQVPAVGQLQSLKENSAVVAYARLRGQSEVTFTEHFHNDPDGDDLTVSYWSPDGTPIAVKNLVFTNGSDIPDYELVDYRRNRGHRVTRSGNSLDVAVFRVGVDGERTNIKSFTVDVRDHTVVDAGFHRHILKHWDALVSGKSRRVNFLRVEKGNYLPLVIKRRQCDVKDGSVCFRIALKNFILKNMLPDIKLAYHPQLKRLVRYNGLGPLSKINGKGMPVTISYDYME